MIYFFEFIKAPSKELTMSSVFLEFEFDPDDDPENRDVRISSGFLDPSKSEEIISEAV